MLLLLVVVGVCGAVTTFEATQRTYDGDSDGFGQGGEVSSAGESTAWVGGRYDAGSEGFVQLVTGGEVVVEADPAPGWTRDSHEREAMRAGMSPSLPGVAVFAYPRSAGGTVLYFLESDGSGESVEVPTIDAGDLRGVALVGRRRAVVAYDDDLELVEVDAGGEVSRRAIPTTDVDFWVDLEGSWTLGTFYAVAERGSDVVVAKYETTTTTSGGDLLWETDIEVDATPTLELRYTSEAGDQEDEELLVCSKHFYARLDADDGNVDYFSETPDLFWPFDERPIVSYDRSTGHLVTAGEGDCRECFFLTALDADDASEVWTLNLTDLLFVPSRDLPDDEDEQNAFDLPDRHVVRHVQAQSWSRILLTTTYEGTRFDEARYYYFRVFTLRVCDGDGCDCQDDPGWHKRNESHKNCNWVSELREARCDGVRGEDGAPSDEACARTCGTCDPPGSCVDDDSWFVKGQDADRNCAFVALGAKARCKRLGDDDRYAFEACPSACSTCDTLVCDNSADGDGWHKTGDPDKDCGWVGQIKKRCLVKSEDGSFGFQGCPAQCGLCDAEA